MTSSWIFPCSNSGWRPEISKISPSASTPACHGVVPLAGRRRKPQIEGLKAEEAEWKYDQQLKARRVCYSGHREVTLSREEVLKEFIPHLTLLIEVVLKTRACCVGEEWRVIMTENFML